METTIYIQIFKVSNFAISIFKDYQPSPLTFCESHFMSIPYQTCCKHHMAKSIIHYFKHCSIKKSTTDNIELPPRYTYVYEYHNPLLGPYRMD